MDSLTIDGQLHKLVKVDKPQFALKSVVDKLESDLIEAARVTLEGEQPIASVSLNMKVIVKDCLKIGDDYYAYYPIKEIKKD